MRQMWSVLKQALPSKTSTLPARLQILEVNEASASSYVEIEIAEGKFHQVKAHGRCLWQAKWWI